MAVASNQARARSELADAGFSFYQPKSRERVVHRGVVAWRERLLIAPYILIEMTFDWTRWFRTTFFYVRDLLKIDERVLVARDHEVRRMMGSEVRGYVPIMSAPLAGTPGRIKCGQWALLSARFDQRDDERGVDRVLVEMFGTLSPVELSIGSWEPA